MTTPAPVRTGWPFTWVAAFQRALGPINRLPGWLNEPLSALALLPLAWWLGSTIALPAFLVLSHLYEQFLDPWGPDAEDVLLRAYGAVLVTTVWRAIFHAA